MKNTLQVPEKYTFTIKERNGGQQAIVKFENGYSASVIRNNYSYTNENEVEIAVLHNGHLDYSTPITSDVLGHQSQEQMIEVLSKIAALPHK